MWYGDFFFGGLSSCKNWWVRTTRRPRVIMPCLPPVLLDQSAVTCAVQIEPGYFRFCSMSVVKYMCRHYSPGDVKLTLSKLELDTVSQSASCFIASASFNISGTDTLQDWKRNVLLLLLSIFFLFHSYGVTPGYAGPLSHCRVPFSCQTIASEHFEAKIRTTDVLRVLANLQETYFTDWSMLRAPDNSCAIVMCRHDCLTLSVAAL